MNGVIYNENFVHSWCDHWSGYFADMINDDIHENDIDSMGPKTIFCKEIAHFNRIKSPNHLKYLNKDKETFIRLVENSHLNKNYNYKL